MVDDIPDMSNNESGLIPRKTLAESEKHKYRAWKEPPQMYSGALRSKASVFHMSLSSLKYVGRYSDATGGSVCIYNSFVLQSINCEKNVNHATLMQL
jgi:hypothetical protein